MVLIPEIVDAVAPVPVLGAGGIGRGRQMAAAMALGAQGVWCGSVWLTTDEAETHPVVKEKFLAATSADTLRSRSLTGKPARHAQVGVDRRVGRATDTPDPLGMPLQPILTAEAQRRIDRAAYTKGSGAEKLANYFVGQIVGTMNQPKKAAQVVYRHDRGVHRGGRITRQAVEVRAGVLRSAGVPGGQQRHDRLPLPEHRDVAVLRHLQHRQRMVRQ